MLFRRKRKKKQQEAAPQWFMWLMGGFVVYAILSNVFTDKVSEVQRETAERTVAEVPDSEYFNFPVVVSGAVGNTAPARQMFLRDVKIGSGSTAECWHDVAVHYRLYNAQGDLVEDTRANGGEPVEFSVGGRDVVLALERTVLGMKEGGQRAATAHPDVLYGDRHFQHPDMGRTQYGAYMVTLERSRRPENLPFSDLGLRIYNDTIGEGRGAQCTDRVRVRLRGWEANGSPLWREHSLPAVMVRVGEGKAPYAVERALLDMKVKGKRTLIVPPGYMAPLHGNAEAAEAEAEEAAAADMEHDPEAQMAEADAEPAEETPTISQQMIRRYQELRDDNSVWATLPIPDDRVIILELEMLPENLELPEFAQ